MALQLRRGSNAERIAITFAEGELVYTTDTKKIWVGDGITAGGITVASGSGTSIGQLDQDLNLNNFNITGNGDISIIGSVQASLLADDGTIMIDNATRDIYGKVTGQLKGSVLAVDGVTIIDGTQKKLYGSFIGDLYAQDNTLIFDKNTRNISASTITANQRLVTGEIQTSTTEVLFTQTLTTASATSIKVISNDESSILKLTRNSAADITGSPLSYGSIYFERDDINGPLTSGFIVGGEEGIFIAADNTGNFPNSAFLTLLSTNGNVGIGNTLPAEKLTVEGNAKVSGFVQFGSITTTQRNALISQNGMVIYNLTDNKFQGYQNGAWINLDTGTAA